METSKKSSLLFAAGSTLHSQKDIRIRVGTYKGCEFEFIAFELNMKGKPIAS